MDYEMLEKTKEMNKKVCDKVWREYSTYLNGVKKGSVQEAIDKSCETTIKEDIACVVENTTFSYEQAKALYDEPNLLQSIYDRWQKMDSFYMEDLTYAAENTAESIIRMKKRDERMI